jgi:acetyltransferase
VQLQVRNPERPIPYRSLPPELTQEVRLPNGALVTLRPIRPEDADLESEFVRRLSPESRFYRFMAPMGDLSLRMVERFTNLDYAREMALVAITRESEGDLQVGVARYSIVDEGRGCEFAVVVSDKWQGKGIARLLMLKLMDIARNRGLEVMEGQVLTNNFRMLELMTSLNFQISNDPTDPGIKLVVARLN